MGLPWIEEMPELDELLAGEHDLDHLTLSHGAPLERFGRLTHHVTLA
jgi:hypothetical protein